MSEEKILKSEELTNTDLDEVAGGTREQSLSDNEFLRKIGVDSRTWVNNSIIRRAWATVGVDCRAFRNDDNKYFLNGKEITQDEARIHAIKFMKNKNK
ncbi:MAG: hypothetical protein IJT06_07285 [Selenomonadaceae bacterium]|nr:hypothetical protein [Selenomonadaceae bacterium]